MKKSYIALAVLAMAALAGCQENEITNEVYTLEKGEVLIRLANGRQTKSMDAASVIEGATIELGTDENGTNFVLEETITNLDNLSFAPETKGTPGYTENFADLYKGFNAAVYKGGSVYEADGAFEEYDKANLIYKRKYPNDIWDGNGEPDLYFFLRTPASYIDANITSDLSYNTTNGSISFSYTSPTTADAQQDMLFTSRPLNTAADFNDLFIKDDQGLPVLFHHALTGVKFAIGNAAEDNVTITKVEFTGLKTSGSCVITPIQENGKYEDNHTNYSSATAVVWTPGTATAAISQEYNSVTSYEQPGTGVSKFAENYYQGGNSNNLSKDNDATAAQTFWLIPQTLTDDVKLTVSYSIDGKAQEPWEIDFGSALKKNGNFINWQAGELRTYTLKVDAVKVHIEDQITTGGAKQGVAIKNTGNTKSFIRATIIGNWCAENGEAVFGFTDFIDNPGEYVEIPSWTIDNTGGGVFAGLPGTGWVRATDGFFYFTTAVEPGKIIGTAPTGATASDYVGEPLFVSYTPPTNHPDYQIAGKYVDSHFVMEIATQAVNANNTDGSTMTWKEAWAKALGTEPATN